jgi:hypothetical protein
MSVLLDHVVKDAAARSVLCWLATADETGQPNVSPKEIFAIVDDEHLAIANIASPQSAKNIRANAKVCVSFIDILVQKGFKITGMATDVRPSAPEFQHWVAPLRAKAGERFPIHSVFVVRTGAVEPIVAPSYRLFPAETSEESQIESALRTYGLRRP